MPEVKKRGRPLGDAENRKKAIAKAAIEIFQRLGYDKSSIRQIAEQAGVDPKLVSHYFGSKANLFAEVLTLPQEADTSLAALANAPKEIWGELLTKILLNDKGYLAIDQMVGVIKSAASEEKVAQSIRAFYLKQSIEPILKSLAIPNAAVRAKTMTSLLAGLTFSDQIVKISHGDESELETRRKLVAKLIQTILTENLD